MKMTTESEGEKQNGNCFQQKLCYKQSGIKIAKTILGSIFSLSGAIL